MAGAAIDGPRLWGLLAREAWRKVRRRLRTGPVYRWRYAGRTPERVLIAPPDLRIADRQIAQDIYSGRYAFAGRLVETAKSPFAPGLGDPPWQEAMHGFRWLRHMRQAGTELAAANARALVADWINSHGRHIDGIAWQPDVTARRIIAWLQHSTTVLQGAEYPFYRAFLRSLAVQIRYLRSMAPDMRDGEERVRAAIALVLAALSLPSSPSAIRVASRTLADELDRQILPDGGHVSRNPQAVLELLADLLPLRQTYANQAETPPGAFVGAIERMLPALRFFRHQDGSLARFNGMGAAAADRIAAVLHHDDTGGKPLLSAPHSGYQRLSLGNTTVIADTGIPPAQDFSRHAHAGTLSFELSSGRASFIVNAGVDAQGPEDYLPLARATAAHSTAILNDASSCRFSLSPRARRVLGTPLVSGPRHVPVSRTDADGVQGFVASHDGYVPPFGIIHEREMALSHGGSLLEGHDRFSRPGGGAIRQAGDAAIRFHIHPSISVSEDEDGRLTLSGKGTDAWVFTASGAEPHVEESVYFAGIAGPRRSLQIVLAFRVPEVPEVAWRFTRVALASGS